MAKERLPEERQKELNEFYWATNISTTEIAAHFGVKNLSPFIIPISASDNCPNCGSILVYKTRSARKSEEKNCVSCTHQTRYYCRCNFCENKREKEARIHEQRMREMAVENFNVLQQKTANSEYVEWAISKLSRKEKVFLQALLDILATGEEATWEKICNRAKVVSHKIYVEKLLKISLLYHHPDGMITTNPALKGEMIEIKNVRNISKSLRFEVFQRDNHTCQYCGRRVPDVVLEVDHLIPVAKGGTDDFDNLVTSCEECNRGKSAKLIKANTGGFSKDEWREKIRAKRIEALEKKRLELNDVFEHWAKCRGVRRVSDYDVQFVLTLVESYDPEWIKAAISIATKNKHSNYGKYTAGILKNWAQNGAPEIPNNPDASLDKRKATPKQVSYIQGLLRKLGLDLGEVYSKSDFDELTMLDARNLIQELTSTQEEERNE